jgi:hypothetical protein
VPIEIGRCKKTKELGRVIWCAHGAISSRDDLVTIGTPIHQRASGARQRWLVDE